MTVNPKDKHFGKKDKSITLEDLEVKFLSDNKIKRHRNIQVEEYVEWNHRRRAIRQAMDDRQRRKIRTAIFTILLILILIPIILPDRYVMAQNLINIFLAAVSGFAFGKMNI